MFNNADPGPSSRPQAEDRETLGLGQPQTQHKVKSRAISARQGPSARWRFSVPSSLSLGGFDVGAQSTRPQAETKGGLIRDRSRERHSTNASKRDESVERPPLSSSYVSSRETVRGKEPMSSWSAIESLLVSDEDVSDGETTPVSSLSRVTGEGLRSGKRLHHPTLRGSPSGTQHKSYATFSGTSTPSRVFTPIKADPSSPFSFTARARPVAVAENGNGDNHSASRHSIFTPARPSATSSRIKRQPHVDTGTPCSSASDDQTSQADQSVMGGELLTSSPPPMQSLLPGSEGIMADQDIHDGESTRRRTVTMSTVTGSTTETHPLLSGGVPALARPSYIRLLARRSIQNFTHPSPAFVAIFKCSLAYLIASLFTFVPQLSNTLSRSSEVDAHGRVTPIPAYSAHMVATIVVYFNPAKTLGHMILATRYCFVLAFYAAIFCLASIATVQIFDSYSPVGPDADRWDWVKGTGDWITCIVWIGGSTGLLAWLKGWVGNPSFNTGCSMAAVTLFTVVVKEGGVPKLLEVLAIVLIGAIISNVICFVIFPISATSRLQRSIITSLTSFRTLLSLLTSTFLLDHPSHISGNRVTLRNAVDAHAKAFRTLKADLAEAKNERAIDGRIGGDRQEMYDVAVQSLTRLAQHLTGLRSGTGLQEELLKASKEGRIVIEEPVPATPEDKTPQITQESHAFFSPAAKEDDVQDYFGQDGQLAAYGNLFVDFREAVGPQMRSLQAACSNALLGVQDVFIAPKRLIRTPEPAATMSSALYIYKREIDLALKAFSKSSNQAIKRLYAAHPHRQKEVLLQPGDELGSDYSSIDSDDESSDGSVALQDGPNEAVFLMYFFLFTLEEFARELSFLCEAGADVADEAVASRVWLDNLKSLLTFGIWTGSLPKPTKRQALRKRMSRLVPIDPSKLQPPVFPKHTKNAPGTLLTPSRHTLSKRDQIYQSLWALSANLQEPDVRYAVKTGIATAMLAAPAFTVRWRPTFLEYRGEWALIAFFATMSPTLGQTNFLSLFRVLGTLLGAAGAVIIYTMFPDNPVMLPILGWLFSIPCFWIITQRPAYAQAGRFILLTYNLTCLYAFNQRDKDLEATTIAFRRATSVIVGVIWAAIVSRYWWPYTARKELRNGLSDFCLDLSYLYSRLVSSYSAKSEKVVTVPAHGALEAKQEASVTAAPEHLTPAVKEFMAMELHLQRQLLHLRDLLAQTKNEPRIKGPFAYQMYDDILFSCERMLDRLHSMRCVTTREEWDKHMREAFIIPVNPQRREMDGNVILFFYTLSAAFRLRSPLPPYLPPAEDSRERLVSAIRNLDIVKRRSVRGGGRHLLFFAYALAMQEIISELGFLGESLQEAFGVISQSAPTDFDAMFAAGA